MDATRYPLLTQVVGSLQFQDLPRADEVAEVLDTLSDFELETQPTVVKVLEQTGMGGAAAILKALPPSEFGDVIFQYTLREEPSQLPY